ncbi:haloacid dehalogenase type II [Varunaivibrio sulfuroxidans]|uniref:(S)-2-haloacid dehalogenase n=1 Tax=Varunaivibrio sulfuroxidans TaxID=1773489 RepID=A0A4R3JEA7_9PROT|nr:haloacid dehalogenase type II [Varunaivibrio sulfuroxidans]TCS64212.1 2-haloacid dehalogenase [Varunaivibrio sulfuroxidans]WES31345.1 haloacid dehalogenase type II [Varunaivibrio sulfuroxidans]
MIECETIDACVFDAYGTLFDVTSAARHCQDKLGENWGPFAEMWRTKQLEYTWLRSLMGDYADFWQVTGDALDYAIDQFEVDDLDLRAHLMELYLHIDAYPEVADVLGCLKNNGIRTAILSNGSPAMLAAAVDSSGLADRFQRLLSADALGIYKPHPSVYQSAVDELLIDASRICFLSSNAWDIAGASHFGFQTIWVNRRGGRPEELPGKPLGEIDTLEALPDILGL